MSKYSNQQLIVVKNNDLIDNTRFKFNLTEYKIIFFLIHAIKKNDREKGLFQKNYTLYAKDLINLSGTKNKAEWQRIAILLKGLLKKTFTISVGNRIDEMTYLSYVSVPKNFDQNVQITFSFTSHLKPYLLSLKKNFTSFDIQQVFKLSSIYSIYFYKYLKRYQYQKYFILTVEQIRLQLTLTSQYSNYSDFRKRVLETARQDTFKHTDLSFEYEPCAKDGRKIVALKFKIVPGKNPGVPEQLEFKLQKPAKQSTPPVIKDFMYYGLPKKEVLEWLDEKGQELLEQIIAKWKPIIERGTFATGNKITNPIGLLRWAVKDEVGYSEHELEQLEAEEAAAQEVKAVEQADLKESDLSEKEHQAQLANYLALTAKKATKQAIHQLDYKQLTPAKQKQLLQVIEQNKGNHDCLDDLIHFAEQQFNALFEKQQQSAAKRQATLQLKKRQKELTDFQAADSEVLFQQALDTVLGSSTELNKQYNTWPQQLKTEFKLAVLKEKPKCKDQATFEDMLVRRLQAIGLKRAVTNI